MYLCHSEILMPKDTESLGNNKAPACESRGFVRKIMKVCILTHLHFLLQYLLYLGTFFFSEIPRRVSEVLFTEVGEIGE